MHILILEFSKVFSIVVWVVMRSCQFGWGKETQSIIQKIVSEKIDEGVFILDGKE